MTEVVCFHILMRILNHSKQSIVAFKPGLVHRSLCLHLAIQRAPVKTDQTALKRGVIRILVPVVEFSSIFLNHYINAFMSSIPQKGH